MALTSSTTTTVTREVTPRYETHPKTKSREARIFATYSGGLKTNRDAWVSGFSADGVTANVERMSDAYNNEVRSAKLADREGEKYAPTTDSAVLSWDQPLRRHFELRRTLDTGSLVTTHSAYRPFVTHVLAFGRLFNNSVGLLPLAYPDADPHQGIVVAGPGAAVPFTALLVNWVPDLSVFGAQTNSQFFPRYTYAATSDAPGAMDVFGEGDQPRYERIDNITDEVLTDYQNAYDKKVTKDDIFFYVYGLLHSREYRAEFEADLKKMLPRIPKVKAFKEFVKAGRDLSALHLDYENVPAYPLIEDSRPNASLRVTKMRYAKQGRQDDKTTIIFNDDITLRGIPEEAQEYLLGSRSALDWIIERYQVKTDKASGIVNDPNAWGDEHDDPRYILDLVKRITTMSIETVRIVKGLPSLEIVSG